MKTPPHRIALVALILLVLAGVGMWWWQSQLLPTPRLAAALPKPVPMLETVSAKRTLLDSTSELDSVADKASRERCDADMTEQRRQRWQALGTKTDTESRLTHALMIAALGNAGQQPTTMNLLDALAKSAPDDAEVAWYRANNCPRNRSCDREQAIGRVLELEPDNLAGWLMALNEAENRHADEASVSDILARAGEAKYYDTRDGESFDRIYQAIKDIPLPESCRSEAQQQFWKKYTKTEAPQTSEDMAVMFAMIGMAAEVPSFRGVNRVCMQEDDRELAPSRVKGCMAISAKLADGSSLIDQIVGLHIMISLTQGEEAAPWRERYRRVRWLYHESYDEDTSFNREALLQRMTDGEIASMRGQLQARKRWPPPADWLPDDERARSLIQTGRPPPKAR